MDDNDDVNESNNNDNENDGDCNKNNDDDDVIMYHIVVHAQGDWVLYYTAIACQVT